MKTRRDICINNSLVHGICNCNCATCGINKPNYEGPKQYQSQDVARAIVSRLEEAARAGLFLRQFEHSGDGEPTLHPEFGWHMDLYGSFLKRWTHRPPPPEIAIVSNGLNLSSEKLETLTRNRIGLKISFPTSNPAHYGEVMLMNPAAGTGAVGKIKQVIQQAMTLAAAGKLPKLAFHISPPFHDYIRKDFPETIRFLAGLAKKTGLERLQLVLFPSRTNRSGSVKSGKTTIDFYPDFFKRYQDQHLDSVKINMELSYRTFYRSWRDFADVLFSYRYPCLWFAADLFLSPEGDSYCCNDQAVREKFGNIQKEELIKIIELKEEKRPTIICRTCNQNPSLLLKAGFFSFYHFWAVLKIRFQTKI